MGERVHVDDVYITFDDGTEHTLGEILNSIAQTVNIHNKLFDAHFEHHREITLALEKLAKEISHTD